MNEPTLGVPRALALQQSEEFLSVTHDSGTTASRFLGANDTLEADDVLYCLGYILSFICLALFCFYTRSRIPGREYRIWERRRVEWIAQQARTDRMSDPNYRVNLVMKGILITKIIEEKGGQLILGDDNGVEDCHSACCSHQSIDSMDENANTCVICLEAFRVGDVVAWSGMLLEETDEVACNHVFHKDCILPWLMHPMHDDCPNCRSPIVKEASETGSSPSQGDPSSRRSISGEGPSSNRNVAFVIMRGLVSRVRRARNSLIGQSFATRDNDDDPELGRARTSSAPASVLRRALTDAENLMPSPPLRRRSALEISTSSSASLPDNPSQVELSRTAPLFRRTVSDVTGLGPSSLHMPRPRPFGQARLIPYPIHLRATSFGSSDSSGRDISECTMEEEEEFILQPITSLSDEISRDECDFRDE